MFTYHHKVFGKFHWKSIEKYFFLKLTTPNLNFPALTQCTDSCWSSGWSCSPSWLTQVAPTVGRIPGWSPWAPQSLERVEISGNGFPNNPSSLFFSSSKPLPFQLLHLHWHLHHIYKLSLYWMLFFYREAAGNIEIDVSSIESGSEVNTFVASLLILGKICRLLYIFVCILS